MLKRASEFKDLMDYYENELFDLSVYTQTGQLQSILSFLDVVKKDIHELDKEDILRFNRSEYLRSLKSSSRNKLITNIKKYLNYNEREDIIQYFKKYREESKEINVNELITREDLKCLLAHSTVK
ncbi:MAG: hypothetical protein ACXAEX_08615 [Promethearchaeota archaeon]